ncbi:MAG TPA: glycerol-3-phosphate 1-O-acyltransferase PlsY [Candidatus Margulisiibacteriota bacterium]|nr:glycerol-3-phosphate 1-O-acyltransferase PlsY [Candidatus Margulisiibacteriota bacterium]
MLWIILGILVSYLIGSIPTAYIFGKVLKGVDIRKFGSGNVGATNALRVLGKGPGVAVLLLDILKGLLAVVLIGDLIIAALPRASSDLLRMLTALSCILGHNWTIFLNFKGGKGVATTLGVLLGLSFKVAGINWVIALSILTWILIILLARIVSVASALTALFLPLYMLIFRLPKLLILGATLLSILVILRHKTNLVRVIKGQEPRLSFKKSQ